MTPEFTEHFLIDEHGRQCEAVPEAIEMLLEYPDADFDIAGYAIRNLGWIEVRVDPPSGTIRAKFRALTVSFGAVSALYALLSNQIWTDIRFDYDLFGWMTDTYGDNRSACAGLHFVVQNVIDFFHHPPYTSVNKNPGLLREEDETGSKMLSSVLGLWQERSGLIADDVTHKLREIGILPRLMLIDVDSTGEDARFRYIGDGFTVYGDRWPREAIGRNIREQPDTAYGARVAESCMTAAQNPQPSYTHVDACIGVPGHDPRRSRYKCLKTPWRNSHGGQVLMITSVLTPDVDIPLVRSSALQGH
jgi:hypothetical protein